MAAHKLPPDLLQKIKPWMKTGRYASEGDALREVLQALRRQDDEIAAIAEGIDEMEAGRVKPLREFDRDFRERKNIQQDM